MTSATPAPLVPRGLLLGVVIVLVGLVFLTDGLGMLDASTGWAIWPVAVIVAGVAVRLQPGTASGVVGIFLIVAGVWLLFNEIGIWSYSFWKTWPLILIFIGAWIRYQVWQMHHRASGQTGAIAFLSQVTADAGTAVPGVEFSAFAGDGLFEFGNVGRGREPIVVNAFALAGRVRLAVPADWVVEMRVLPLAGRAADAREHSPGSAAAQQPDLIVTGTAILGIVEVLAPTAAPQPATAAI